MEAKDFLAALVVRGGSGVFDNGAIETQYPMLFAEGVIESLPLSGYSLIRLRADDVVNGIARPGRD